MKSRKRSRKNAGAKRSSRKRVAGGARVRAGATGRSPRAGRLPVVDLEPHGWSALLSELSKHGGASPTDSGGDVDADWKRGQSVGEEAVGGTVATPDQDIVDDLARPLGVERAGDTPVISSETILRGRDRRRWRSEQTIDERAREDDEA